MKSGAIEDRLSYRDMEIRAVLDKEFQASIYPCKVDTRSHAERMVIEQEIKFEIKKAELATKPLMTSLGVEKDVDNG